MYQALFPPPLHKSLGTRLEGGRKKKKKAEKGGWRGHKEGKRGGEVCFYHMVDVNYHKIGIISTHTK